MERTFMMFKPDMYETSLADGVISDVENMGFKIVEHFKVRFTSDGVFILWPRIFGCRWISNLIELMPQRPLDVFVLEAPDSIDRFIDYKDSFRSRMAPANSHKNLIHSPDTPEAFAREYSYLKSIEQVGSDRLSDQFNTN